jgi:tetratricopeptide (TPR) repeat protein
MRSDFRTFRRLILAGILLTKIAWAHPADSFQYLMDKARDAQLAGQTDQAAQLYQAALKLQPHSGPAEYGLGLMESVAKNYPAGVELLTRALHDDPTLTNAYLFLGIAYLNLQKPEQALPHLEKFYRLQPSDPEVRFFLAGTYNALGNYPKAAQYYADQLRLTPDRTELWYDLGECLLDIPRQMKLDLLAGARGKYVSWMLDAQEQEGKGNLTAAEGDFREAIKADPAGPEPYVALGNLLLSQGTQGEAKAQFQEALQHAPQNCRALEGLGDVALAEGDIAASLAEYAKVATAKDACLEEPAPVNLGLSKPDFTARIKSLSEGLASPKSKAAAAFELTRLQVGDSGGSDSARTPSANPQVAASNTRSAQACRAAAAGRPWAASPGVNLYLANCLENRGDLGGSIDALNAAGPHPSTEMETGYWSFRLYMRLAQEVLGELANRAPDSYLLSEVRAESFELQGRDDEAEQEYNKAIAGSGADPNPFIQFGRFRCKRNQPDGAVTVLKEALALSPYNVMANDLMGQAYYMKTDYSAAIPYLQSAVKASPRNEDSRIRLAESLGKTGENQKAAAILEAAPADPDGRVHYVLAGFYRKLGEKEQMTRALAFFEAHKGQSQRELPSN